MLKDFFSLQYNDRKTVLILFLFLFHMLGVRLFPGIGFLLAGIIFMLLARNVRLTPNRVCTAFFLAMFASIFQLLKGSSIGYCVLVALYVMNAILLIYYVRHRDVRDDFKAALKIFVIQAFISAPVYLITPKSLLLEIHWCEAMIQDRTILGVFYYTSHPMHMLPFLPMPRIGGWAWEPGCLQLLINLYICLEIFDRVTLKKLVLPSVVLVLTASTTGYIIWALNIFLYMLLSNTKRVLSLIPLAVIIAVTIMPIMVGNIVSKLQIGSDSIAGSGAVRMRDFFTGIEEIKQYPWFGIDVSDLSNSRQYQLLEDVGLSRFNVVDTWRAAYDYAAGGYCNGFFAMHMFWGLLGFVLLFWFVKCKLWKLWSYGSKYWYFFPTIISLTLVSEPISNSSFFFFLCFYNFLTKPGVNANFNYNSNVQCG